MASCSRPCYPFGAVYDLPGTDPLATRNYVRPKKGAQAGIAQGGSGTLGRSGAGGRSDLQADPQKPRLGPRSLSRVLRILELLSKQERGQTLTDLCRALDSPRSSILSLDRKSTRLNSSH